MYLYCPASRAVISTLHSRTQTIRNPREGPDHPQLKISLTLNSNNSTNESHHEHGEETCATDGNQVTSGSSRAWRRGTDRSSSRLGLALYTTLNNQSGEIRWSCRSQLLESSKSFICLTQSESFRKELYGGIDVNGHDHTVLAMFGLGAVEPQCVCVVDGDGECGDGRGLTFLHV